MEFTNFDIIDALEKARPPAGLFNQYAYSCDLDTIPSEGAELRRERLLQHLSCKPRILIICGDADVSAQLTGIPMTSEEQITDGYVPRVAMDRITTNPDVMKDWRSNLIWDEMEKRTIADQTIIWAAQPFYTKENVQSRRRKVPLEVNYGLQFLSMLLARHPEVPILAVGTLARTALALMDVQPVSTLPHLKDVETGRVAVVQAFSVVLRRPKRLATRSAGKHVRDFFAQCRENAPDN